MRKSHIVDPPEDRIKALWQYISGLEDEILVPLLERVEGLEKERDAVARCISDPATIAKVVSDAITQGSRLRDTCHPNCGRNDTERVVGRAK